MPRQRSQEDLEGLKPLACRLSEGELTLPRDRAPSQKVLSHKTCLCACEGALAPTEYAYYTALDGHEHLRGYVTLKSGVVLLLHRDMIWTQLGSPEKFPGTVRLLP